MQENDFLNRIMVLPVKPDFVGFTVATEDLFKQLVPIACEIVGHDISSMCGWGHNDEDGQFYFYIDQEELEELLGEEEYDRTIFELPFDIDASWEVADVLLDRLYNTGHGSWVYASVRLWDSSVTEVQIGIPRNL
jgi:hypothetical protein